MKLTIVGCGDAFGSGGRLMTCFHVAAPAATFLIDCGASTLIGIRRLGLDPNGIGTIFLSHLHGDHFGGLPFFMLDAQLVSKRTASLTIAGPAGTEQRYRAAAEALFPRMTESKLRFEVVFREYAQGAPLAVGGVSVTPYEVKHASGAPPYALRFEVDRKTVAFTGDTEWVESVVTACRGADLMISECYWPEGDIRFHLSWEQIARALPRIAPRRLLLTHMSATMLARRNEIAEPCAILGEDGMVIEI